MTTMRTLAASTSTHDPKLLRRLGRVTVPTLLLWGESDRIVSPVYGAAYAAALGDGRLEVVPEAGHLPQIEQPDLTFALVDAHLRRSSAHCTGTR